MFRLGRKGRFLAALWLGVGLYIALVMVGARLSTQSEVDVLGFAADEVYPSVEEVVAQNRTQLMMVSATPPSEPLLPDLVAHPPSELGLVGSSADGTLRLKFTTRFSNQGEGPLEVRPESDDSPTLLQIVYSADPDAPLGEREGVGHYTFEQRHGHLHIDSFAHYELWAVDEQGELEESLVSNPKVGFCLIDAEIADPEMTSKAMQVYWGCRSEVQGLSPGWGDVYTAQLAMQDLNISGLPDGRYALVNVINVQESLLESNYSNNRAWVYLSIVGGALRLE